VPYFLLLMAQAYRATGQIDKGLTVLNNALAGLNGTGEHCWEAEIYRLHGEFLLLQTPPLTGQATASWQHALDVARQQGARLWELRLATTWSHYAEAPHRPEAQQRLQNVYGWFTEGFTLADLITAREHLEDPPYQETRLTPALLEGEAR
jgi:predicted ATPase